MYYGGALYKAFNTATSITSSPLAIFICIITPPQPVIKNNHWCTTCWSRPSNNQLIFTLHPCSYFFLRACVFSTSQACLASASSCIPLTFLAILKTSLATLGQSGLGREPDPSVSEPWVTCMPLLSLTAEIAVVAVAACEPTRRCAI